MKALLKRPLCTIRLAVLTDTTDVVLGWSAQEGKVLHFVFVRANARKRGIGRSLVPGPVDLVTHMTNLGRAIWKKQKQAIKFNPF